MRLQCPRTEARAEANSSYSLSRVARVRRICAVSVECGCQGCREAEPESTKGAKDYEGEGVSDYPLDWGVSIG